MKEDKRVTELTIEPQRARTPLTPEEVRKFEGHAAEIFARLGLHGGPGTSTTPQRWLKALVDLTSGYDGDEKIRTIFPNECPDCPPEHLAHIVEGPIHVLSTCEHHILPIIGEAYIGYIAAHSIIGISKFVRLLRLYSRRFTSQERITHEVASSLMELIKPQGAAVSIKAHHLCSIARGVREIGSATTTMAVRGIYSKAPHWRDEFIRLATAKMSGH